MATCLKARVGSGILFILHLFIFIFAEKPPNIQTAINNLNALEKLSCHFWVNLSFKVFLYMLAKIKTFPFI